MSTCRELPRRRRSWPSPRLLCVGALMLLSGCSRQSSPPALSLLNSSTGMEHVHSTKSSEASPAVASMLAAVRAATAKYHDVSQALGHGYQLGYKGVVTACIANPGVGAMGYHYFNWTKMDDPSIVQDDPEVLVYRHGRRRDPRAWRRRVGRSQGRSGTGRETPTRHRCLESRCTS